MLQVSGLSKGYAHQNLFEDISFNIAPGEKVALTGRNGYGKTTILRILAGEETADSGSITVSKDFKIGYLKQNLVFEHPTARKECISALPAENQFDHYLAEKSLFGLGFSEEDLQKSPESLSGGFQVRLNLAKLLISGADLLLLDEPTNYLDIISVRWLKRFLQSFKGALLIVTHDREFLDETTTHIMTIHRGRIKKLQGNTEKMYLQIAQEEEIYEKTRQNDEKERERLENFVNRFRAKARLAGQAQSRMKMLKKMEKRDKLAEISDLDFVFSYSPTPSKWALETHHLSFAYTEENPLIQNLSLLIRQGERVAVIGKNGAGKSTLIRLFAGILNPKDGEVKTPPNFSVGYYGQTNRENLNPHLTVEEEIMSAMANPSREGARSLAGSMLFSGEMSQKKIDVLSGGEKARVALAKIIASPCSALILDEPTNHLDMQSCDALLEALDNFEGAVILITHNEMFLHALAERLIVFDGGKHRVYESGYEEFLETVGWEDERKNDASAQKKSTVNKKEIRKLRAALMEEKNAELKPILFEIEKTENSILETEEEKERQNALIIQAYESKNNEIIESAGRFLKNVDCELEALYDKLENLEEQKLEHEENFASRLKNLE